MPTPDISQHRPDPAYARELFESLRAKGVSQREVARCFDISDRTLRYYASGEQPMPYLVQFALECWASADRDSVDAARYRYLRDDNAYQPEEQAVRGGELLDKICDEGISAAGNQGMGE